MSRVSFSVMRPSSLGTTCSVAPRMLHVIELLAGEGVRGHDVQRIALHRADQRQGHAGAAARCTRRPSRPAASRPSASAASIIASAIRSFMLPVGFSLSSFSRMRAPFAGHDVAQGHQRGVADAVQDGPLRLGRHGGSPLGAPRLARGAPSLSGGSSRPRGSGGQLRAEHIHALDDRRRREQGGACAMSAWAIGPSDGSAVPLRRGTRRRWRRWSARAAARTTPAWSSPGWRAAGPASGTRRLGSSLPGLASRRTNRLSFTMLMSP